MLRKINAGLSLFTTVLFIYHAVYFSVWMLLRCSIRKSSVFLSFALAIGMIIHAVLSIIIAVLSHKDGNRRDCKKYSGLNASTYIQRATGVATVLLLGFHIAGALNHFKPVFIHAVVHPLFFAVSLIHTSVSMGKAMITLGWGNAKSVKLTDILMKIICILTFVACVIGFYICLFVGVAV